MKKALIWLLAIIVIAAGVYWWIHQQGAPTLSDDGTSAAVDAIDDAQNPGGAASTTTQTSSGTPAMAVTVNYDGNSFTPNAVAIKQGGTVTFVSNGAPMWVASDLHPTHTQYDGTSRNTHCAPGYSGPAPFDQCSSGTTYSFTFDKVGRWTFHNHLDASKVGSVTVVQ